MATLRELAEHGLRGMADSLPVPVGVQLSEVERLRARVTGLEADVAAKAQDAEAAMKGWERARARVAELEQLLADAPVAVTLTERASEAADKLTRLFAPTQALREDPHDGPLHHTYRVPRDLPETGGAS
jgi:hypothetical protein